MVLGWEKPSRRATISTIKGTIAYTLAFILVFIHGFNRLSDYPVTLTGIVLIAIAGQPGLSVGACWDQAFFGSLGVAVGGACFAILAKLGHSQVAQGFVLAAMVYVLAIIKAQSMRYFAFSLLAIILAFSGIYTSQLSGGEFVPGYLESYLEAYCWGFAIVLVVNLVVLPHSSEKELRELLVLSIEHISTFSHLIAKTYSLEISEDERKVRDALNASIRADMGLLNQKIATVGLEVNYSRYSMQDYARYVQSIRSVQRGLITAYSSLTAMERYEPKALALLKEEIQQTAVSRAFNKLRRTADLVCADIVTEFAVGKAVYHSPAPGQFSGEDFHEEEELDVEAGTRRPRGASLSRVTSDAQQARLASMATKLRKEVQTAGSTPMVSRRPSLSNGEATHSNGPNLVKEATTAIKQEGNRREAVDKVKTFRAVWQAFQESQHFAIQRLLSEGAVDEELYLHQPGPSVHQMWVNTPSSASAKTTATSATSSTSSSSSSGPVKRATAAPSSTARISPAVEEDERALPSPGLVENPHSGLCGQAVMRVFAFVAGMGQVVEELACLHESVVPKTGEPKRKKTIRFHLFESTKAPKPATAANTASMELREAIAKLSGQTFTPRTTTFWQKVAALERSARSPTSVYAAKTAAAVSVYAVFLLAPSLRQFFIDYGLTAGIITLVVAMAPTLGQTGVTFVMQILGSGGGSIIGMILCYIARSTGGYAYNPFVLVCLLGVLAVPCTYIIATRPQFFAGALLLLNSAGALVITEYTYGGDLPAWTRPGFDSPALRCAKQLVAMCLALAIAGVFQGFILRQPARRTLRKKVAQISWEIQSYTVLLGYASEALMPMVEDSSDYPPPDWEALEVVRQELITREAMIQANLLALMPLMKFSSVEPSFGSPFKGAAWMRVVRTHQLLLDRLRESRYALGADGFSPAIRRHFAGPLVPYRRQGKRIIRAHLYLAATSLSTKHPLPTDLPPVTTARHIQHDSMILSGRLARTEEGRAILASPVFLRYYFYLVSYSSIAFLLEGLEPDLRELFGCVEDSPFVAESVAKTGLF